MKAGINIPNFGHSAAAHDFEAWVVSAERLGFHLAMISDDVKLSPKAVAGYPPSFYDPFTTLAWLAGRTTTIGIGATAAVLPYRHPLHAARIAANIDMFSGGRLVFGVGVGWSAQEFAALGLDYHRRDRVSEEYLECILRFWQEPALSMHGRVADHATAPGRTPAVWVCGLEPAALRRAGQFGDAWHPHGLGAAALRARLPELRAAAEEFGRPTPALAPRIALHLTSKPVKGHDRIPGHGTLAQVHRDLADLAELGATHVVLDPYLAVYCGAARRVHRGHDVELLQTVAESLLDLPAQSVR